MESLVYRQFYWLNYPSSLLYLLLCSWTTIVLVIQTWLFFRMELDWHFFNNLEYRNNLLWLCWNRWNYLHPSFINRNTDNLVLTILLLMNLLKHISTCCYDTLNCKRYASIFGCSILCCLFVWIFILHNSKKQYSIKWSIYWE